MSSTGFIYSPRFPEHDTGPHHPECAERAGAICHGLRTRGLLARLRVIEPKPADEAQIRRVHASKYIEEFRYACGHDAGFVDSPECPVVRASYEVAMLAAGAVVDAVDAVMDRTLHNAFCSVRPPGHHAERAHAMGFCYFNNVAIGAEHLRMRHDLERVAILDWDVHHGNGTQHHFENDPNVLYISIHQDPRTLFPGTGWSHEVGVGEGVGATLNVPMMPASGDREYRQAFETRILPAISAFRPEFLLLSAGFDAHREDPLGHIMLSTECFGWLTVRVRELAEAVCGGRMVSVLEGGYYLPALADSVYIHIEKLMDSEVD
ncbi:MAG: histone deacetylase [Phycisphaerales bacterium]|nr:histone deacetylase [Phycisphaerales bacterium]